MVEPKYPITAGDAINEGVQIARKLIHPSAALVSVDDQGQAVIGDTYAKMARYDFQGGYALVSTSTEIIGKYGASMVSVAVVWVQL